MRNSKTRFVPEVNVRVVVTDAGGSSLSPYEQELAIAAAIREAKAREQAELEAKQIFGDKLYE